jgi:hypothetical protein
MYNEKMKVSRELYKSILDDCRTILHAANLKIENIDGGRSGLSFMYELLNEISFNRANDDKHPAFQNGKKRLLPYDGRKHCFYYENGINDSHINTMLSAIKIDLLTF